MKQRFLALLWILISTLLSTNVNTRAETSVGQVVQCVQEERYGNEVARQSEYWQFRDNANAASETYIVDYLLSTPVCSRIVSDLSRNVVYYQEGDVQSFFEGNDFGLVTPCWTALENNGVSGQLENEYNRVNYRVVAVAENRAAEINYPTEFLLAPTFIGRFPLLVDAPLMPYEGRGFIVSIPANTLFEAQGIDIRNGRMSEANLEQIAQFYLTALPDWTLANGADTDVGENPLVFPGGFVSYLALQNPTDDSLIELEFNVLRDNTLLLTVSTVPPAATSAPPTPEVLTGSSNALATKPSLFVGWSGAENGATFLFLDGRIEAYHLTRGEHQWFFDLAVSANTYEMIYNRRVQQANTCNPSEFLPEWAVAP